MLLSDKIQFPPCTLYPHIQVQQGRQAGAAQRARQLHHQLDGIVRQMVDRWWHCRCPNIRWRAGTRLGTDGETPVSSHEIILVTIVDMFMYLSFLSKWHVINALPMNIKYLFSCISMSLPHILKSLLPHSVPSTSYDTSQTLPNWPLLWWRQFSWIAARRVQTVLEAHARARPSAGREGGRYVE